MYGLNRKHLYEVQKYCSYRCARLDPKCQERRSKTRKSKPLSEQQLDAIVKAQGIWAKKKHEDWLNSKAKTHQRLGNGEFQRLDITNRELEEYRKHQHVCEICGNKETCLGRNRNVKGSKPIKLSADHNHKTGHFRGLLCFRCNSNLGWYEEYRKDIEKYLEEKEEDPWIYSGVN